MSSNRDDFSEKIKGTLAKRAGWRCSNPACRCYTSGPHTEADKSISIGVAAHICAAAVGGPRYDKNMSTEVRSSIENGIWLCQTCSRLIDTDESRYPVSLLHKWKREAEEAALNDLQSKSSSSSKGRGIPVKAQNDIIAQTRILMEYAKELYKDYQGYRPCWHEEDDTALYNRCVGMINALFQLLRLEGTYHKQLHELDVDKHIFKLRDQMPGFHDETADGTGCSMIYTIQNYLQFFTSKSAPQFSKTCKKIIKLIEET